MWQIFCPTRVSYLPLSPSVCRGAEQAEQAGGRSHFSDVPGTMGYFFLEQCCILTAALPLVHTASPFTKTGSWNKQQRRFHPIRGPRIPALLIFTQSLSLICIFGRKVSLCSTHTRTPNVCLNNDVYVIMSQWPKWKFTWCTVTHNDTFSVTLKKL